MACPQEDRKPRTLVLCFDGTSNEYDADNTNVVKLFALLNKDDFDEQLCYYQAGVGTYFEPGIVSPIFEWGAKVLDLAFAWYLDAHVMDGYTFLMQNYRAGDRICIFGFSRGAYTARALGGLLYKVGLLPRGNEAQVPFAYRMYKRTDAEGIKLCAGFKQTYCQTVNIEFMGVWETVASVGVLAGRTLPFTNSNSSVKTFRHALSLDEHRAKFKPNNYHRPAPNERGARNDPEQASPVLETTQKNKKKRGPGCSPSSSDEEFTMEIASQRRWGFFGRGQKIKIKETVICIPPQSAENAECDDVLESLSNISLRWMVCEIVAADCGIKWDIPALARANIELTPEPTAAEIDMDMVDAVQPLHDELKMDKFWWLLEIIPLQSSWQDANGVWHRDWGFNFGRGRKIVDPQPNFHASVQKRIASPLKYTPKAKWKAGTEIYIR